MRRSALISFFLHLAIILAVLITLPPLTLPQQANDTVDVDIVGLSQSGKTPGKVPAPTNNATQDQKALTENKPKPQPFEAPPPPPPPPPKAPETPKAVTPPKAAPPPPPQTESPSAVPLPKPPPLPPQKNTSTQHQQTKTPPKPQKPQPAPKSPTHQTHELKTPVPLSQSVLNTLLNLKSQIKQTKAPTHVYNPEQTGKVNGGGNPQSTANSGLTAGERNAIGQHVQPCFQVDAGAPGLSSFSVNLLVTTDPTGTVREAQIAPQDQGKLSDPIFAAYAQRAVQAVMNYQCATLPLPSNMLGQNETFLFNFTPGD